MTLVSINAVFVLINVIIAIYDFSFYRIPNIFLGALLVIYGLYAPFYLSPDELLMSLVIFGVVLIVAFGLFSLQYMGAGDAKYLAVVSIWFGFAKVFQLILLIAVAGGVLAVICLVLQPYILRGSDLMWTLFQKGETRFPFLQYVWIGSGSGPEREKRENIPPRMIPYGVAIATGSILMMFITH